MKKIIVGVLAITILLAFLTGCTEPAVCGNNLVEPGEDCDNTECSSGQVCEDCNCNPLPQVPPLPEE